MKKRIEKLEKKIADIQREIASIKKNIIKRPNIGDVINIADIEWVVLDKTNDGFLVITKEVIGKNVVFDEKSNDWRNSKIRHYLNEEFLKRIEDEIGEWNLLEFKRDLLSLDGQVEYGMCDDKVSLLTVDEYRKYRSMLPNIGKYWWLITPWSTPCNGYDSSITVVSPSGDFNWCSFNVSFGVRPVCIFSSEIFESEEE